MGNTVDSAQSVANGLNDTSENKKEIVKVKAEYWLEDGDEKWMTTITIAHSETLTGGELMKRLCKHFQTEQKTISEWKVVQTDVREIMLSEEEWKRNVLNFHKTPTLTIPLKYLRNLHSQTIRVHCIMDLINHRQRQTTIDCPHLTSLHKDQDVKEESKEETTEIKKEECAFYDMAFNWHQFTADNYRHLQRYNHWTDNNERPICDDGSECSSYQSVVAGSDALNDLCHLLLFRHPPRKDRFVEQISSAYVVIPNMDEIQPIYQPNAIEKVFYNTKDGYLSYLIQELKRNDYYSTVMFDDKNQSIIDTTVASKLNHPRHKGLGSPLNVAEMIALILYCKVSDLNVKLCASQRNGDYQTWKWFDLHLYNAIRKLWTRERTAFETLYSGVTETTFNKSVYYRLNPKHFIPSMFLYPSTYMSTTTNRAVADIYAGDKGIVFVFEPKCRYQMICCDVSWLSSVADEAEVLMARAVPRMDQWGYRQIWVCQPLMAQITDQSTDNKQIIQLKIPVYLTL